MTSQMGVLYLKDAGQVLAVFTRDGLPQQAETQPDVFVGVGLLVRGVGDKNGVSADPNASVVLPAQQLAVLQTDFSQTLLRAPRSCFIDTNNKNKVCAVNASTLDTSYTGRQLTVKVPTPFPSLTAVNILVAVQGPSQNTPIFFAKPNEPIGSDPIFDLSAGPSGQCTVFIAVTSFPLFMEPHTF